MSESPYRDEEASEKLVQAPNEAYQSAPRRRFSRRWFRRPALLSKLKIVATRTNPRVLHYILRFLLVFAVLLTITLVILLMGHHSMEIRRQRYWDDGRDDNLKSLKKTIVMASYQNQDVSWLKDMPKDYEIARYVLDDPDPNHEYTVPRNQGREAMAFLSYIVDHYDDFPDIALFIHGHLDSWHQPEKITSKIRAINITALQEEKYFSLRCNMDPHCGPGQGYRYKKPPSPVEGHITNLWDTLFPQGDALTGIKKWPNLVRYKCCAQFAVSKEAVVARPLKDWVRFRRPLLRDIEDFEGLRGMERPPNYAFGLLYEPLWHILFGKGIDHCHAADHCRKVFFSDALKCDWYPNNYGDYLDHKETARFNCTDAYEEDNKGWFNWWNEAL